jgi:hydroxymethylpyrimidine/phosphomethylpyrimidine kinase
MKNNKIILTIAGSDSSGGAGIQADIKTFSALNTYAASVITAVTAQNTHTVDHVAHVPDENIQQQIECVFSDLDVAAVKIGMIVSPSVISLVHRQLISKNIPIVLDPVMISKSGCTLLGTEACATLKELMIPAATVLTPNVPEAACLLGTHESRSVDDLVDQGEQLMALGCSAIVMKGGHLDASVCTDVLIQRDQAPIFLEHPRVNTNNTHGTGCTYSAAMAAFIGRGYSITDAVRQAHNYLYQAIVHADKLQVGSGHGPTHHFHDMWS